MAKVYLVKKCYSKRKCHNKLDDTSSSAHRHCFDFFHLLVFVWTFRLLGRRSHFDQRSSTLPLICCLTISPSPSPYYHHALTIWHYLALNFSLGWFESWVVRKAWQSNIWDHFGLRTLPGHLWENFLGYFFSEANSFPHRLQFHVLRSGESVRCDNTGGRWQAGSVQVYNIAGPAERPPMWTQEPCDISCRPSRH